MKNDNVSSTSQGDMRTPDFLGSYHLTSLSHVPFNRTSKSKTFCALSPDAAASRRITTQTKGPSVAPKYVDRVTQAQTVTVFTF
jgi:hypothetical protein